MSLGKYSYFANAFITALATTVTPAETTATTATTASGGLKIESSLLQATCLITMSKILRLFL